MTDTKEQTFFNAIPLREGTNPCYDGIMVATRDTLQEKATGLDFDDLVERMLASMNEVSRIVVESTGLTPLMANFHLAAASMALVLHYAEAYDGADADLASLSDVAPAIGMLASDIQAAIVEKSVH